MADAFGVRLGALGASLGDGNSLLSVDALLDAICAIFADSEKLDRSQLPSLDRFVKKCTPAS